jgi:carbon-monoxide dehydrogenase small subunit
MTPHRITLRVNGKGYTGEAEPRKTLADFIREDCGLTGTHLGCEHGVCGACTILMNGEAVRSCLIFAVQAEGADLMTVEGLADGDRLHPIQQAYWDHHALQCGFCTPGFLMTTVALLRDNPRPTEREIREGLAGNLCRCTGYQNIVTAVAAAADALASGAVSPATASRGAVPRAPVPASGPPAQAPRDVDGRPPAGRAAVRRRKRALTMKKASKRKRKPSR